MTKLTNEMRFKTAEERVKACTEFLKLHKEYDKVPYIEAAFNWLALEAEEEKPEPCFYCGHEMHYRVEHGNFTDKHWLECTNNKCNFESPKYESKEAAIAAHNRVARAVMAAREGEVK